ncbi:MAG: hypothetical protein LWX70_08990 [Sphingobacteriia bacterium]|nr:hypothetical protein [Sphingobacteriia bacterium]
MNQPCSVELLFDKCQVGQSSYGEYYLYAVRNGDGQTEYSFFAPTEVHDKLKDLKKGDRAKLLKRAEQRGSKIITVYEVEVEKAQQTVSAPPLATGNTDNFYQLMLESCRDAVKIQNELGGLMDAKSVAVTLFIARSRVPANGYGGSNAL